MQTDAGFVPIVFGADTLGYSYAREFHSVYATHTNIVAPQDIKYSSTSRFTNYEIVEDIDSETGIVSYLRKHAAAFEQKTPLALGGSNDAHARTLSKHRPELEALGYAVPYAPFDVLERVIQKDRFYGICEQLNIPHPKTALLPIGNADATYGCEDNACLARANDKDFAQLTYPLIVKPSNSADWHYAKLRDRHKVYVVHTPEQLQTIVADVRDSGYSHYLVFQELLDDVDDALYSLTLFADGRGNVPLRVSGHVLVQDRSATGIGNPLVILGEDHPELLDAAARFLVYTNYEGYANFDVMRDAKTGELKFLEVNARPGRNSYYVSLAGCSFVAPIVEHFVRHAPAQTLCALAQGLSANFMFSMLPRAVVAKELKGRPAYEQAMQAYDEGLAHNPLLNAQDTWVQRMWARINYEHMRFKF